MKKFFLGFSTFLLVSTVLVVTYVFVAEHWRLQDRVQAAMRDAQLLRDAPPGSQFALALTRSIPTYNGRPWWGLCAADPNRSPEHVRNAVWLRPATSEYYRNFQWHVAREVRAKGGEQAFVTYALGPKIAWSKKPVTLEAGERIITDGTRTIRANCCNELALEVPKKAEVFTPEEEKVLVETEMRQSETPGPGVRVDQEVLDRGDVPLSSNPKSGLVPVVPYGGFGASYPRGGSTTIITGGGGGGSISVSVPTPTPTPPVGLGTPSPIPEPGTWIMVLSGLVVLAIWRFGCRR